MPSTFPVLQLPALSQTCADSAARALPSPWTIVDCGWAAIPELGSGSVAVQFTVTSLSYQPFAFGCEDACPVTVGATVSRFLTIAIPPGSEMRPLATPSSSPIPPSVRVISTRLSKIRTRLSGSSDHCLVSGLYFAYPVTS